MSHPLAPFLDESRRLLGAEYLPKLRIALAGVDESDLWWRPNPSCNSMGNLGLHLAGNVRQWIVHGLGGGPDVRERAEEFARTGGMGAPEVLARLARAVADADAVLARLDPGSLSESRSIQGVATTGIAAIYHVVEHFSMHTGQILYLAKMRGNHDLGFYSVDERGRVTGTHW
ncbi:MAG: DUF664 domain-containing protein [Longimicrobiales bacterium]|nr:DUF664 domain-containing protein [Longimicrobiales bacterium]